MSQTSFAATVYFNSGFETGNVSEWIGDGGGNHTGGSYVSNEKPRTGNFSWKAYNDPNLPSPDDISAKLLRWRFDYPSAYYSAWFFWPADYPVSGVGTQYINFFQWKEKAAPYNPVWVIAAKESFVYPGNDEICVHDWYGGKIYRNSVKLPKGRWFHVEAFMKEAFTGGQLTVWLDGQQIFNLTNLNTSGGATNTSGFLMWGVGNYGNAGIGKHIYVDNAIVSDYRVYLSPPQNLTAAP